MDRLEAGSKPAHPSDTHHPVPLPVPAKSVSPTNYRCSPTGTLYCEKSQADAAARAPPTCEVDVVISAPISTEARSAGASYRVVFNDARLRAQNYIHTMSMQLRRPWNGFRQTEDKDTTAPYSGKGTEVGGLVNFYADPCELRDGGKPSVVARRVSFQQSMINIRASRETREAKLEREFGWGLRGRTNRREESSLSRALRVERFRYIGKSEQSISC
ncbi:hypothetical protein R3P38DRAFT_3264740, partial [Favolaschia claudopus]